jgi:RNHCP domain
MRPDRIDNRAGKGMVVIHECVVCGFTRANRIAGDSVQSDNIDTIITLMTRQR